MPAKPFSSETVLDGLASFEAGMNSGIAPMLLPRNQLSFGTNTTVRGAFASHRPPFNIQTLDFGGNAALETAFKSGLWQGCLPTLYRADSGVVSHIVSISGHLYMLTPVGSVWSVQDISIAGDYNDPTVTQVWMWQAEKWVIVTDGTTALPIYSEPGVFTRRSIGNSPIFLSIVSTNPLNVPAAPGTLQVTLTAGPLPQWQVGTPIQGVDIGQYVVASWATPFTVNLTKLNDIGPAVGAPIPQANTSTIYPEFPAGRMGAYGMGRNWMSLIDGKQFIAGDIVGGPSGSAPYNYRDAVLHSSENSYLAGGGYFTTPGAWGDIRAMIFASTLDVSMGQGPLQVMTPTRCFSCYAPVDRTVWAVVTNPILTESLISNGSEGHYGTVNANGDILFRAVDGIRSLVIGRRDFETWGNTPISVEMDRVLSLDQRDLLRYSSAIVFDNRLLMTAGPNPVVDHGVFHTGLVALNFDPVSSLRGKTPSVYDGLWTGLNTLQLAVGRIASDERAFAFTYNLSSEEIELYEILTTPKDVFTTVTWPTNIEIYDNEMIPIVWTGESPVLFKAEDPRLQDYHELFDGELLVDNLVGTVYFQVFYKPDQYPCWTPWFDWWECAPHPTDSSKPQFRPSMGLGQPPIRDANGDMICDASTNRPMRQGYTFQVKWIITGHCRFLGARFKANTAPIPQFSKQQCIKPNSVVVVQ